MSTTWETIKSDYRRYSLKSLIALSKYSSDQWTVDDAMKGVSIMGGTGSGKTTASGRKLALTYLEEGWGGLVLCAKTDEAKLWLDYCKESKREKDLMIFRKNSLHTEGTFQGQKIVFNPIDYELRRTGEGAGETQNITNIFMNIYRMGNRIASEGDTHEERYWDTALKRCLNRVIELLKLAGEDLSYSNMVKVVNTSTGVDNTVFLDALVAVDQGNDEFIRYLKTNDTKFCLRCLVNSYFRHDNEETHDDVKNAHKLVEDYFCQVLPRMGSRTKSVVTESFMGLAEPFLSGLLYSHFSGATNIFPELIFEEQKIIVLDFSIKDFLDAGIIAQCVFKLMFQQAVERRNVDKYPVPAFLWCDEAQYFINPYDQIFLTTARSSRTSTVYLSQNISNYFAVMGSGSDAKARVDSLMGNLSTKIFHANSDSETNEYASRLIGNTIRSLENSSEQQNLLGLNFSHSEGQSSQFLPQIQPRDFTVLKTGGERNGNQVQGILFETGREWENGKNFLRIQFTQKFY